MILTYFEPMRNIYLIGFMGCGKTYAGKKLAKSMGMDFLDLDLSIIQSTGFSIQKIFSQGGETYFREIEAEILRKTSLLNNHVIACGGGTPCFHQNIDWINQSGYSIFLDASQAFLLRSLKKGKSHRPMINNLLDEELEHFISVKLGERRSIYLQAQQILPFDIGKPFLAELTAMCLKIITSLPAQE